MKRIRKRRLWTIISILLVLMFCTAILSGCYKPNDAGEISNYDSQAFIPVGNTGETIGGESTEGSESTAKPGGFVVSEKKYDFEGNNLVVLNVENQTSENYSIAIHGTYLDENGVTLKEETKTFEGFAAGWKNYFFFVPEIPFVKFTYTLESTEYTGECYGSLFTPAWRIEKTYDLDEVAYRKALLECSDINEPEPNIDDYFQQAISLYVSHSYEIEEPVNIVEGLLILSEGGEVLAVYPRWKQLMMEPGKGAKDDEKQSILEYLENPDDPNHGKEDKFLKKDITILFSITNAKLWEPDDILD